MPTPEFPSAAPETGNDDSVAAFNARISRLADNPDFVADHFAHEEAGVVLDQLNEDTEANTMSTLSGVHKYFPELTDEVRLHDGDMVTGLEYNNGKLSFHGEKFGALDGKSLAVPLAAHERRSGTIVTTDGRVVPFIMEGNHDAEEGEHFPLFPSEVQPPLPPLYARGGLPPEIKA